MYSHFHYFYLHPISDQEFDSEICYSLKIPGIFKSFFQRPIQGFLRHVSIIQQNPITCRHCSGHVQLLVTQQWNPHNGNTPVDCFLRAQQPTVCDKQSNVWVSCSVNYRSSVMYTQHGYNNIKLKATKQKRTFENYCFSLTCSESWEEHKAIQNPRLALHC